MVTGLGVPDWADSAAAADLAVRTLGPCRYPSPLAQRLPMSAFHRVGQAVRVRLDDRVPPGASGEPGATAPAAFELAGPRDRVFFDSSKLCCGIVTCGGLCPGLNDVVRGLVLELEHGYRVPEILGFRHGYEGLIAGRPDPLLLTSRSVANIQRDGGTVLGTSRGQQDVHRMVDRLEQLGVSVLFVVGGDGSLRGASALVAEISRRGLSIGVIGVPKTIDNDIHFIDRSFGFETAFAAAVQVVRSAHVEAMGARNGIGVVKLMGRHSGFVACHAALAATDVDLVLVPEVPIQLEGPRGVLAYLERRLSRRSHVVIVVAEGAGQELWRDQAGVDASGNARLHDIGLLLRERIAEHFTARGTEITLKYIDPSYHIRSVPASPTDSVFCWNLARNAVHAAMAGNTDMLIGRWHGRFVHVPIPLTTRDRKQVDTAAELWMSVVEATGQPPSWIH